MGIVTIKEESGTPKYKQIVISIEEAIVNGSLKKGDKLPSLNSIKNQFSLSRDTVLSAFNELKIRGIVQSVVGKGYYVLSEDVGVNQKIFVLFDELNSFKEDLYNSFLAALGEKVQVDIFFHHFNPNVFDKLIKDNDGNYSHYVIMPANLMNTEASIKRLPDDKVYILDQVHKELLMYPSVYQNFKKDIYEGLTKGLSLIKSYEKIILLFSDIKQPSGIKEGFEMFCLNNNFKYEIIENLNDRVLSVGELYMLLDDRDLIRVIKRIKVEKLVIAKDIGVISVNDSLLKEIVEGGITTISTDFNLMGKRLAHMIMNNEFAQIENPNNLIVRKSL
ncbi:GntR family transcriptional regulator [Winogradskyella thalassocola]|uniref:Regulatory protein, gntR family n=1 Tax=Winogradskyella thalassocola TaxID=262004 RepID=A0A1G7WGL4_9FLAO|nr:GntR family transcriptional regulator [Winogradskyella thalassocola]SDG71106.1 regulatory protein, gntR family [Winogradskyella thalassocola]